MKDGDVVTSTFVDVPSGFADVLTLFSVMEERRDSIVLALIVVNSTCNDQK